MGDLLADLPRCSTVHLSDDRLFVASARVQEQWASVSASGAFGGVVVQLYTISPGGPPQKD